jgi:hypothetical protein
MKELCLLLARRLELLYDMSLADIVQSGSGEEASRASDEPKASLLTYEILAVSIDLESVVGGVAVRIDFSRY